MRIRRAASGRFGFVKLACGAAVLVTAASAVWAGQPLFAWQVRSDTATVTMVGSIHFGRPDFYPLPGPLEASFAEADVLAVEVDLLAEGTAGKMAQLMVRQGMLPEGQTLATELPDTLLAGFKEALADQPEVFASCQVFKPAFAALVLAANSYDDLGFDPELGLEWHYLKMARDRKEIREIETLQRQMALFTGIDPQLGILLLESTLQQLPRMAPLLGKLVEAWKSGDADRVDSLMAAQVGEDPAPGRFLPQPAGGSKLRHGRFGRGLAAPKPGCVHAGGRGPFRRQGGDRRHPPE